MCGLLLLLPAAGAARDSATADCDGPETTTTLQAADSGPLAATAVWLDARTLRWPHGSADGRFRLHHSAAGTIRVQPGRRVRGADDAFALTPAPAPIPEALARRFDWVPAGVELALADVSRRRLRELHRGQLVLVEEDSGGRVRAAASVQHAAALDALYGAALQVPGLGADATGDRTVFRLWAPTARSVSLCLYADGRSAASDLADLQRDEATGVWSLSRAGDHSGQYYSYLVEVFVAGVGMVRNRVTDPYALSLTTDSRRAYIAALDAPALKPEGWDAHRRPAPAAASTDAVIYELHVRDFSSADASVPEPHRGKYLAFATPGSDGMRHLRTLAQAGLTDVHLLPVFDIATIPESGCLTPRVPDGPPAGEAQQAGITKHKSADCFNWGYDPFHFTAPEGSYATDPADGARRVVEFRTMVQALHEAGLRVGLDVVYNHTSAAGQHPHSVLDRIVPGYYHRLHVDGSLATSTCCANTATEHAMMARLMIDSAVAWVRHYRIDAFRFDLMGHQPREAMERLQAAVDAAAGRHIALIGEGWNFGEVADGARFVQASQQLLAGSGIATFSDRMRDAARGGGAASTGADLQRLQGWLNGLHYAPNAHAGDLHGRVELLRAADLVRAGLAGTLGDYRLPTHTGSTVPLSAIDYAGQPAGYAAQPGEVVNYVENHDNETLFDINAWRLPRGTSREDRARVQILGAALVAFAQGIAYYHAGVELLRSKSLDRNSYDSGDWFNLLDWSGADNGWGRGLPPGEENARNWPLMRPLLADARIRPGADEIAWTRATFRDLLRIRASTTLLRLRTAQDVRERLRFLDTGPAQRGSMIAARIDGEGYAGAGFGALLYAVNADPQPQVLELPREAGQSWVLHPVHRAPDAADRRAAEQAAYGSATGSFRIPGRTAVVFVQQAPR